jgi:hypothetical protein
MSRPNQYKYFTDAEITAHVQEVERQLDERAEQQANAARDAQIAAWIADPRNKAVIDSDPMVRALRAMPQPGQPTQRNAPAPATPVQKIGFSNAAIDPYVHSPSTTTRTGKSQSERYGPNASAVPSNGYWTL